jgi:deoxyribodipyrimidine photo-lyase
MTTLPTQYPSRQARADALAAAFPASAEISPQVSPTIGGRSIALPVLQSLRPADYARTRNYLDGAVTRLSPYVRHGAITLSEMHAAAISKVSHPNQADKFLSELGWRDYYQRIHALVGNQLWKDLEPYKTGYQSGDYARDLPADIPAASTGLACIDAFSADLHTTGYLHNHARMWMAAYIVHHRRVSWQAGAVWFLQHLLDGDIASNNLSWQWVASTFSHKPYYFDRGNLDTYTAGRYCPTCPARTRCPFDGGYDHLARKLFRNPPDDQPNSAPKLKLTADDPEPKPISPIPDALAYIHDYALRPTNPALLAADVSAFIWDPDRYAKHSLKRLVFISECLSELPTTSQHIGHTAELLTHLLATTDKKRIVTTATPDPFIRRSLDTLSRTIAVEVLPDDPFVTLTGPLDLTRFTRYWKKAEPRLQASQTPGLFS